MIPEWVNKYVGLQFEQYNCWQLVCLIYKEQCDIELPTFDTEYRNAFDKCCIESIYKREMDSIRFKKVSEPNIFDIVVLRIDGQPWHCGIVLDDKHMIHTDKKIGSVIESYKSKIWMHRVLGFYEYIGNN